MMITQAREGAWKSLTWLARSDYTLTRGCGRIILSQANRPAQQAWREFAPLCQG